MSAHHRRDSDCDRLIAQIRSDDNMSWSTRWSAAFRSTKAGPACNDWSTKYSRTYEGRTERTARPMNFAKEVNDVYEAGGFGLHMVGHH
jgi:hypothetical protein